MEQDEDFLSKIDADLFEEHFLYWNSLPLHLKMEVLRYCSYPTLRNFMFLSKECNYLVSNMRIPVHAISLEHYRMHTDETKYAWIDALVHVCYMPCMTHNDTQGEPFSHDFRFDHKKGGGCTREEYMWTRTKKCHLVQKSYSELDYPDSEYTASTKVFLGLVERLNAEHVLISLALVEGIECALKNLPPKLLITCSSLTVMGCRSSFLKLLFPFVNRGCGLRIYFCTVGEEDAINHAFDSEIVKTAPFLEISGGRISDEQLLCLKAYWIYVSFARPISEEGLSRLIMQRVDGKRRINRLYLEHMLALTENMVYKLRRCKLIPETELIKTPFLKNFMEEHFESGFCVGIRNKAGNLILVNVSEESCEIADPYSEYDPPVSRCSIVYPDDDDDD